MSSTVKFATLILAGLGLVELAAAQGRQCYFPNHSRAENFTECNAEATQSSCCRDTEACLSNGYCLQTVGLANRITRGACTDSTFSNAACPQECTDVAPGASMSFYLAYDDQPNGMFCCFPGYNVTSERCQLADGGTGTATPFQLAEGNVIIDRSNGATLSVNTTSSASSTVTVTAQVKSDGNVTAVGAGVGVSLGVLLIAALVGCGMLYNQLRKAKRQTPGDGMLMGGSNQYDQSRNAAGWTPTNGTQTPYSDGVSKTYSHGTYQHPPPQAPVESPFNNVLAEAPADREVAMADSRAVPK